MKPVLCLALLLCPVANPAWAQAPAAANAPEPTIVNDPAALRRLRGNSGITLQWISFNNNDERGHVTAVDTNGTTHLYGFQRNGEESVEIDGDVVRIDSDRFTFRGTIDIRNAPDPGRVCTREGEFEFRVTQNRRYWRLQQMEACDGLTDYVDIYF